MPKSLSNPIENNQNLETYCLIWLDTYVNNSDDNRQAQQRLQTIIHHLLTFEDNHQCLQYIRNLSKDDRVIFIVSGQAGRTIVPEIVNFRQIASIYIYCFNKKANEQWSQHFNKVKGVVVQLSELIQRIEKDYIQLEQSKLDESLSIKFLNIEQNKQFLHSQLLIDCLIRLKSSIINTKTELISFCKEYYKNNPSQLMIIQEFEQDYSPEQSLVWYTKQSFLSRLLNKALREENIDLLFLFRFIIYDIGYQLGKHRCLLSNCVYRSQLLPSEEVQLLIDSIGQIISMNAFLSASCNHDKTRSSLALIDSSNNMEKVFFEIEVNSQLFNLRPFGFIQSNTDEVLFMVGSIFRINRIDRTDDKIWNVQISLCSLDDKQLKSFLLQMKNQLGTEKTNLFRFGHILYQMEKLTNCEKYYRRYLNQLPNEHSDIPSCYYTLGMIEESKNELKSSLKWYKKSLAIQQSDNPNTADTYNKTANVYFKIGDYTNAMKSYEKASEIWKKTVNECDPRVSKCFNSMGEIYEMKKEFWKALEYYQRALKISKECLPSKHLDLAMIKRNIGGIYELTNDDHQALVYYRKALKIYQHFLPSTQISADDMEKTIQRISSKSE